MTNKSDTPTANTQTTPPDQLQEDLNDLLKDAPDNYLLRPMFEPEIEPETQNQQPTILRPQQTQTDQLNVQSTSTTQTDDDTTSELTKTLFSASPGKQPLIDANVFNHLTTDEGNNVAYLKFSTNLTLKKKRHMYYFPMDFEKLTLDGLIDTGALTRRSQQNKTPFKRSHKKYWSSTQFSNHGGKWST